MKNIICVLCIGFFILTSLGAYAENSEKTLTGGVIRLHVRANSDSDDDQNLKLKVRDRILNEASYLFENQTSANDAEKIINENIDFIESMVVDEISKNGYSYPVKVHYGKSEFPQKIYKNITMPCGSYNALIVEIGSGEGHNWWCVLFPPLCFVDQTCTGISDNSKEILINSLGKDTYEMIKSDKKPGVKMRFKIYEIWTKNKQKLNAIYGQAKK